MSSGEMKAGPELDCLVAERVMGWTEIGERLLSPSGRAPGANYTGDRVPMFSQDIAAAWKVVEKLTERMLSIQVQVENCDGVRFDCVMYDDASGGDYKKGLWVHACEETAPLAICVAALKAVSR